MSDFETAAVLSQKIYESLEGISTFGDSDRYKVLSTTGENLSSGYYGAIVLDTRNNTTFLASRGTEIDPIDYGDLVISDGSIAIGNLPSDQFNDARTFLSNYNSNTAGNPPVTELVGHSLGGYLSQALGIVNDLGVTVFSSPGAQSALDDLQSLGYSTQVANYDYSKVNVRNINGDWIGGFGDHLVGATIETVDASNTIWNTPEGRSSLLQIAANDALQSAIPSSLFGVFLQAGIETLETAYEGLALFHSMENHTYELASEYAIANQIQDTVKLLYSSDETIRVTEYNDIRVVETSGGDKSTLYISNDNQIYGIIDNGDGTKTFYNRYGAGETDFTETLFNGLDDMGNLSAQEQYIAQEIIYQEYLAIQETARDLIENNPNIESDPNFSSLPQDVQGMISSLLSEGSTAPTGEKYTITDDTSTISADGVTVLQKTSLASGILGGSNGFSDGDLVSMILGSTDNQASLGIGAFWDLHSRALADGIVSTDVDGNTQYTLASGVVLKSIATGEVGKTIDALYVPGINTAVGYVTNYEGEFQQQLTEVIDPTTGLSKVSIVTSDSVLNESFGGQITLNYPQNFDYQAVGNIVGNKLGAFLADGDAYQSVVYSTALKSIGGATGTYFDFFTDNNGSGESLFASLNGLDTTQIRSLPDFFERFTENLQGSITSAIGSALAEEIGEALDIGGIGGEVFEVAAGTVTTGLVNETFGLIFNEMNAGVYTGLLSGSFDFSAPYPPNTEGITGTYGDYVQAQVVGALAAYAGNRLAGEVIEPESEAAALFGSAGSALGATIGGGTIASSTAVGSVFQSIASLGWAGGPIGIALGAFIGTIGGTVIGNLFGGDDDSPATWARVKYNYDTRELYLRDSWVQDGADHAISESMAQKVVEGINAIIESTGGSLRSTAKFPVFSVGWSEGKFGVEFGEGARQMFDNSGEAINYAVLKALKNFDLVGGHAVVMRAWHNSEATTLDEFKEDIEVAEAFQVYLANPAGILALMMDDPNSEVAQAWAEILQRAAELELHLPHEKDLDGGWGELLYARGDIDPELVPQLEGDTIILTDPVTGEETVLHHVIGPGYEIVRIEGTDGNDILEVIVNGESIAYVNGSFGDDVIEGGPGDDILVGGEGNDTINGNGGEDWINGGLGEDVLNGGIGDDLVVGGAGDDILLGGDGADRLYGGDGNDTLDGMGVTDQLYGGRGDDVLHGFEGSERTILNGQDGNDILYGKGYDDLHGGDGDDTFILSGSNNHIYLTRDRGNDTVILDSQSTSNVVVFDASVGANDLWVYKDPADTNDLIVAVLGESQSIRVQDYFDAQGNVNSGLQFAMLTHKGLGANTPLFTIQASEVSNIVPTGSNNLINDTQALTDYYASHPNWGTQASDSSNWAIISGDATGEEIRGGSFAPDGENIHDYLYGNAGDDELSGEEGEDYLIGGLGNDTISGYTGRDYIWGGAGNDASSGGSGGDHMYGGWGNDILNGQDGSDQIWGGEDNDTLNGGADEDFINGEEDDDTIDGGTENDILYGGDGNDTLIGGAGDDNVYGDAGDDILEYILADNAASEDVYNGGDGNDKLILRLTSAEFADNNVQRDLLRIKEENAQQASSFLYSFAAFALLISNIELLEVLVDGLVQDVSFNEMSGTAASEQITGTVLHDRIVAGDGDDTINGAQGQDNLYGGMGSDIITGGDGIDEITGDEGDDTISGDAGDDIIEGNDGNDTLHGNTGNDLISAGIGDDIITGGIGEDILQGDGGADNISGDDGNDIIEGGSGDDVLAGGAGDDNIYGASGNDEIIGGLGNDTLRGGIGDDLYLYNLGDGIDIIDDAAGLDSIQLGAGVTIDDIIFSSSILNLEINFTGSPADKITISNHFQSSGVKAIENILLNDGSTLVIGHGATMAVDDDAITAPETAVTIDILANDVGVNGALITLAHVAPSVNGIAVANINGSITFTPNAGFYGFDKISYTIIDDTGNVGFGHANIFVEPTPINGSTSAETINGTSYNDVIQGYGSKDYIYGNDGDDIIYSYSSDLTADGGGTGWSNAGRIYGGSGDDIIYAGSTGQDYLYGEAGSDHLIGGVGIDVLYGGWGNAGDIDILEGRGGDDYYEIRVEEGNQPGASNLVIIEDDGGSDIVNFTQVPGTYQTVNWSDVTLTRVGNSDIRLDGTISAGDFHIQIKNQLSYLNDTTGLGVENVNISGTTNLKNYLLNYTGAISTEGTEGDDVISGITIGSPDDVIHAGAGNDTLYGDAGNDVLYGEGGNDIYVFNIGDGADVIEDSSGLDEIHLGAGIALSDLSIQQFNTNDLEIVIGNAGDKMTILDHADMASTKQVEKLIFNDGSELNLLDVDAPIVSDDAVFVNVNDSVIIDALLNDIDLQGDLLSVVSVGAAVNGVAILNVDGTITYTPNADFLGSDSFTYTIDDGNGGITIGNVSISVNPPNDAPIAVGDTAETDDLTPVIIDVLANDSDADGDVLSLSISTNPVHGSLVINADNTITYTPNIGYDGLDSFDYQVDDGKGGVATSTVNLTVNHTNYINGSTSAETINGTSYNDIISGFGGKDYIYGNDGNDIIYSYSSDLTADGGGTGWSNAARIYGGNGDDIIYAGASGYEYLHGDAGSDHIVGSESIDVLYGGWGNAGDIDILEGRGGDDYYSIRVEEGRHPGQGNLVMIDDNGGTDLIRFAQVPGTLQNVNWSDVTLTRVGNSDIRLDGTISAGDFHIQIKDQLSYLNDTTGLGVENVNISGTTNLKSYLLNYTGAISTEGTEGDDVINGITIGSPDDVIHAGAGNDTLYGDAGNDVLYGGAGFDSLSGGIGSDTFVFESASAFTDIDIIQDFSLSDGDALDFTDVLSGYDPLTDAISDFIQITDNGTDSIVAVDANGGADNFVQVAQMLNITGLTNEEMLETSGTLITI